MEWLRSCYTSQWRLYRDRPDILTTGTYVRCPDSRPCYPGFHNVGSRNWTSDEHGDQPSLGEDPDVRQIWTNGEPPANFPPAILLGSVDCVASGEVPGEPPELFQGYPVLCWPVDPRFGDPPPYDNLNPNDRDTATQFADILVQQYLNSSTTLPLLRKLLGNSTAFTEYPTGDTLYPGAIIAFTSEYCVVTITGTANFQQLAVQTMYAGMGPFDVGGIATNLFWYQASVEIGNRIAAAGVTEDFPIFFAAHSYGAAVAAILAARYRDQTPTRPIGLLAYGQPKPGDSRLKSKLALIDGSYLCNDNDPVPSLPPSGPELLPLLAVIPADYVTRWIRMIQPTGRTILGADGSMVDGERSTLTLADVTAIAAAVVAGDPLAAFVGHEMQTYADRLAMVP